MNIDAESKVGHIATEHPLATRVFARRNIDYCCGGGVSLDQACQRRGLDPATVLAELQAELQAEIQTEQDDAEQERPRWDQAPLEALIGHILDTHHAPLGEELPRLEEMARKVAKVHGERHPDLLPAVLETFLALKAELEPHMQKEEQVLFPLILQGRGALAERPIEVMEDEHEAAGALLARLHELTGGYEVPGAACNTWRALWHGLAALEADLHQHIHLENNVLFPRALGNPV